MEGKLKNKRTKDFIYGFLGYLIGAVIYNLIGSDNDVLRIFSGIFFAIIVRALLDFYSYRKYPEMKEKEKLLEKDEHLIVIRDRAAYFTVNIIFVVLTVAWIITIIKQNDVLSYFISGLFIAMVLTMEVSKIYLNKKM